MSVVPRADASGTTLVLLCGDLAPELDLDSLRAQFGARAAVEIVDGLCSKPSAVSAALRTAGADRTVVGLCSSHARTAALLARARREAASPFGVLAVSLASAARASSTAAAARALAGAVARLDALPADEPSRAVIGRVPVSRAGLLSLSSVITIEPVASAARQACAGSRRCGLCISACPRGAIAPDGDTVSVDTGLCDACGRCVPACPAGAFHLAGAAPRQLEAELDAVLPAAGVAFRCRYATTTADDMPAAWVTIELPSLAPVTAGWILQALAGGAAAVRLLPCDAGCCTEIAGRIALCRTVLSRLGDHDAARRIDTAGAPEPQLVPLDHISSAVVLTEPRATVDALTRLGGIVDATIDDPSSPLGRVSLDATACTLCGACAVACPTRALELAVTDGTLALRYDAPLCTACELCTLACPEHALVVRRALDGTQLRLGVTELATAARSTCRRCGCELPVTAAARRVQELLASSWPELAPVTDGLCSECARRTTR